jgi:uncharacterized membrane protein YkvA (DUF1232 family)
MSNRKLIANPQGGLVKGFVKQLKLIGRLMADNRVSVFVKILPIAALAYLISPVDLAPGVVFPVVGALDDAAIMWIGSTLFVQLCPDSVVKEHMDDLDMIAGDSDDVVDAESRDINDR